MDADAQVFPYAETLNDGSWPLMQVDRNVDDIVRLEQKDDLFEQGSPSDRQHRLGAIDSQRA